MRAFEFYQQKNLLEQASANAKKELQSIIQGVKQNPQNADVVAKKLAALNDAADKIIAASDKQKAKDKAVKPIAPAVKPITPAAPPVESLDEAATDSVKQAEKEALELSSKIDNALLAMGAVSPENKQMMLKLLSEVSVDSMAKGVEKERSGNVEFIDGLQQNILPKLAQKIEAELAKLAQAQPYSDVPTKLSQKAQKLKNVQTNIIRGLSGVFANEKDQAVKGGSEYRAAVTDLLNDFIVGVVDFGEVLKQGSGNITDMVNDSIKSSGKSKLYKDVFDRLKEALYTSVIDIGKGTNMGPGELGLALILKPASKAGKGDLGYGDEVIELKGSRDPKSGARLGLEMGNKSKQVDSFQEKVLDKHFGKGKVPYAQKIEGRAQPLNLNLTTQGISRLNQIIPKFPDFNTHEFLLDSIMLTLDGSTKEKEKWRSDIDKSGFLKDAVNADGTIDYNKWVKALTLIQYDLYGGAESGQSQFKTIMVFSPTSSNFRVVKNSKEFAKAIDDGQSGKPNGVVLSGGLAFNLDKFAKTPQVGIA